MRILLLSAYDTLSHRRWREGLTSALPEHQWTVLTLPPRWFAWRIRGNALSWAFGERALLERGYDRIVATSMTDLSTLRGLVPALASVPALVYFHENQFAYPDREPPARPTIEAQLVPLFSALSADRVLFNSAYNRDSFLHGARALLKKMPDQVPPGLPERIATNSAVLPVPLTDEWFAVLDRRQSDAPLSILWNHRWEYDKGPECFFDALDALRYRGIDFRLQVLGQRFRGCPAVFEQRREALQPFTDHWGPLTNDDEYREALGRADVVVSTALQEFQGLAVLEAVAAGCLPLVPDRLAYRETIPSAFRYTSCCDDDRREAAILANRLAGLAVAKREHQLPTPPSVEHYSWTQLAPAYRQALDHPTQ